MPKRKRSADTVRDTAPVAGTSDALIVLPANNLPGGNSELPTARTNEKGGIAGLLDWYGKVQAVAPIPEPYPLMAKHKDREARMMSLMDMAAAIPQANRQYGTEAEEQWQGLTPPVEDVVCEAIGLGLTRQKAAQLAGHKLSRLKLWLQLGVKGYSPFANFRMRLLRLEVLSEVDATLRVEQAAAVESKSAAVYLKLLERRYKIADDDDGEFEELLPTEQFTEDELRAFVDSKGEVVPRRFKADYIDSIPGDE